MDLLKTVVDAVPSSDVTMGASVFILVAGASSLCRGGMEEADRVCAAGVGVAFAGFQFAQVRKVPLGARRSAVSTQVGISIFTPAAHDGAAMQYQSTDSNERGELLLADQRADKIVFIYNAIREGADGFLFAEYGRCLVFSIFFGLVVFILTSRVRPESCDHPDADGKCDAEWSVLFLFCALAPRCPGALVPLMPPTQD